MSEINTSILENETPESYLYRLGKMKESGQIDDTWVDIATKMNETLGEGEWHDESTWRKRYKAIVSQLTQAHTPAEEDLFFANIRTNIEEIQRQRIRLRDERTHRRRLLEATARKEDVLEIFKTTIKRATPIDRRIVEVNRDRAVYALLGDVHYGMTFESAAGKYNSDIAKKRIMEYADRIIQTARENDTSTCYVSLLGDMISGNIHSTIRIENRENIIEQVIGVSELVSAFLEELADAFLYVYVNNVSGNHSRVEQNAEDALRGERLDLLIPWYCKTKLENFHNIRFIENEFDTSFAIFDIFGKKYLAIHGDMDATAAVSAQRIGELIKGRIDYVVAGHLHVAESRFDNVPLIRNGCTVGSGDEYTTRKRLFAPAMQICMVVSSDGVLSLHPIAL